MQNYGQEILRINWKRNEYPFLGPIKTAAEMGQTVVDLNEDYESPSNFIMPAVDIQGRDLSGPLFEPDVEGIFIPHLADTISTAPSLDAWDWKSSEIFDHKEPTALTGNAAIEAELIQDKRGCVVWNLYETEENYTKMLAIIQDEFHKKLLKQNIIGANSANLMFAGIAELHEFHVIFLQEMKILVSEWDTTESGIGALFSKHVEILAKLYTRFIDNYSISQKCIKKEEKENPDFVNFMKDTTKSSETNRQTLKDILITPVQRTTRYHLLLKDLLKSTVETHPDYPALQKSWKQMADLATVVNDKKRKEEEATGLFDAFEQTKYCPPTLISHRRRLILSTDCICPKSNRAIRLILCSDLLMISLMNSRSMLSGLTRTAPGASGTEYNFRFLRWLDLLETETLDMHATKQHTIRITHNPSKASPSRRSSTTPLSEIATQAKELGLPTFMLVFTGYDPVKARNTFMHAIEHVTKNCKEDISK